MEVRDFGRSTKLGSGGAASLSDMTYVATRSTYFASLHGVSHFVELFLTGKFWRKNSLVCLSIFLSGMTVIADFHLLLQIWIYGRVGLLKYSLNTWHTWRLRTIYTIYKIRKIDHGGPSMVGLDVRSIYIIIYLYIGTNKGKVKGTLIWETYDPFKTNLLAGLVDISYAHYRERWNLGIYQNLL